MDDEHTITQPMEETIPSLSKQYKQSPFLTGLQNSHNNERRLQGRKSINYIANPEKNKDLLHPISPRDMIVHSSNVIRLAVLLGGFLAIIIIIESVKLSRWAYFALFVPVIVSSFLYFLSVRSTRMRGKVYVNTTPPDPVIRDEE